MKKFVCLLLTLIVSVFCISAVNLGVGYAEESVNISDIKDTYKIKTGIIGYPTVTTFIDEKKQLDQLALEEKTPSMAFLRVKGNAEEIDVIDKSRNKISDLYQALKDKLKNKIIPAFYIEAGDLVTKNAVCDFISNYSLKDCIVVSSDVELLNSVYYYTDNGGNVRTRGISCMLEVQSAKNMTHKELSILAVKAGARAVLVDADDYEAKAFLESYKMTPNSSVGIYFKVDSTAEVYKAISCAPDGICIADYSSAIAIYESFTLKTIIKPINLQAHRGTDVINNENTLESIFDAVLSGAKTIEIDPRLTKDKQIVLCHDETIDRVSNGSGLVSDYTLEELKAMKININPNALPSKFCALEDVFKMYQKYGFKAYITLDAKETNPEYIQILYNLIDKYDAWDIIYSVGVADVSQLDEYDSVFNGKVAFNGVKSITVQDLVDSYGNPIEVYGGDVKKAVKGWLSSVNGNYMPAGSVAPYYTGIVYTASINAMPNIVREMNDRGIKVSPYQFDTEAQMLEAFNLNLRNLSTGNATYFSEFLSEFSVDNVKVRNGDKFNVTGVNTLVSGEEITGWANGFILVDGESDVLLFDNGSFVANKNGQVKVMFYTTFNNGKISYARYSDITTVTVEKAERTSNVLIKLDEKSGDSFNLVLPIVITASVVALGGLVTVIVIIKNRRRKGQ